MRIEVALKLFFVGAGLVVFQLAAGETIAEALDPGMFKRGTPFQMGLLSLIENKWPLAIGAITAWVALYFIVTEAIGRRHGCNGRIE